MSSRKKTEKLESVNREKIKSSEKPVKKVKGREARTSAEKVTVTRGKIEEEVAGLEDDFVRSPEGLTVPLALHQKEALAWLIWREMQTPSGGILADDMGLGKTLTMVSLILKSKELAFWEKPESKTYRNKYRGGTLVVCPASLINQWSGEIETRTKRGLLSVEVYHGAKRETEPELLAQHDVVITTYNLLLENDSNGAIFGVRWRRIILDEAHQIKNYKSQTAEAAFRLSGKSKWAVTGTPVHNSELDVYSILRFLRCEPLDDVEVWEGLTADECTVGKTLVYDILASLMKRRTKEELIEQGSLSNLPKKKYEEILFSLDPDEMAVYNKVSTAVSGVKEVNQRNILTVQLRLRQICCHPCLIMPMTERDKHSRVEESEELYLSKEFNKLNISLDNMSEDSIGLKTEDFQDPVFRSDRASSKIKNLISVLKQKISTGDKAIVVSQWTTFLELIATYLEKAQICYDYLHGKILVQDRMPIVDNFNDPKNPTKVLLLSLKAGGVGLNLIGANHLFLLDLHWNPQLERQARDRIYRMGQTKPVFIYKFIAVGTIEEKIKLLQDKKLEIANVVLTGFKKENDADTLSLEDAKMLYGIK